MVLEKWDTTSKSVTIKIISRVGAISRINNLDTLLLDPEGIISFLVPLEIQLMYSTLQHCAVRVCMY